MPDLKNSMLAAQEAIDAAIEVIKKTQQTQDTLDKNIFLTDKKIGIHNTSAECHEDIRKRLEDLPALISDPEITGPSACENGREYTWNISAVSMIPTAVVRGFAIVDTLGNSYEIEADSSGNGIFKYTVYGEKDQQIILKVQAKGDYNFTSQWKEYPVTVTQHYAPDLSNLTISIPDIISYGKEYKFTIDGIVDADDDFTTCDISSSDSRVVFSETTGLRQGAEYTCTVDAEFIGPSTVQFVLTAHDAFGLQSTKTITKKINGNPVTDGFAHNIPRYLSANTNAVCRVSGVTDPEEQEITFDIASSNGNITFSKYESIGLNEDFTISVGKIDVGTPYVLTFTFKDPNGGSTITKISSKINTPPAVTDFGYTEKNRRYIEGMESTIEFHGATDAEGEKVLYEISNPHEEFIFEKTTGIADGEEVKFTVGSVTNGGTYPITVYAYDTSGAKTPVTVVLHANWEPDVSTIDTTIPKVVKPDTKYTWYINNVTDKDVEQELSYSVVVTDENVILENNTDRKITEPFNITIPDTDRLPRGNTFQLMFTITDGLVQVTKTVTITQNNLSDISEMEIDLPERLIPGKSYSSMLSNVSDLDTSDLTYSVTATTGISITEGFNISTNNPFKFIMPAASVLARGTDVEFTITVSDGLESVSKKFSRTINQLPVINTTSLNLPTKVKPDSDYICRLTNITDNDKDPLKCDIEVSNGGTVTDTITLDTDFTIHTPTTNNLARGGTFIATVSVNDGYETVTKQFTALVNKLPTVSTMNKIPDYVVPGSTNTVAMNISDPDGDTCKYSVTSDNENVVLTNNTERTNGQSFTFKAPTVSQLARGKSFKLIVEVTDGYETFTDEKIVKQNNIQTVTKVTATGIPATGVKGGNENKVNVKISGATGGDQAYTYELVNIDSKLHFSKTMGITEGETITLYTDKVAANTSVTFGIRTRDELGDVSAIKTITVKILAIIVTKSPSITYPKNNLTTVPYYEGFSMKITAYATTVWTGTGTYPRAGK